MNLENSIENLVLNEIVKAQKSKSVKVALQRRQTKWPGTGKRQGRVFINGHSSFRRMQNF